MTGLSSFRCVAPAPEPEPTVYSASYATTAADYVAKCGAGTSGASVTRTRTSPVSFLEALRLATADARAAIVCPVPFPVYTTPLTLQRPVDDAGEVTLTLGELYRDGEFRFNANPGGDSTAKSMGVYIDGAFAFLIDFPATYTNTPTGWTFTSGGRRWTGTFTDGNTNAILFA